MKKYQAILLSICFILALAVPLLVLAANPALENLDYVGSEKGPYLKGDDTQILSIIGLAVNVALGLIGVIFLALMLFAGYNWMTAQGEEEKVKKAKDIITRSIIGLIIVIGSYAAWQFVFSKLF